MIKVQQKVLYCKNCKRDTLHIRNTHSPNYLLHLFLIIVTAGLWIPIFILSLFGSIEIGGEPWRCSVCGTKYKSNFQSIIEKTFGAIAIFLILAIATLIVFSYGEQLIKKHNYFGYAVIGGYLAILFGIFYFRHKIKYISTSKKTKFKIEDIPKGYMLYNDREIFVRGVLHRKENIIKWAKGRKPSIFAKPEPDNPYDKNAIAIYGKSSTGTFHIGYIAREISNKLAELGFTDKVKVRLVNAEIRENNEDTKIFIQYDILVPIG